MAPAASEQIVESKEVKVLGRGYVKPKKKIGRKEFQLTTFDLPYLAFYYNQKLLVYNYKAENDFDELMRKLKEGLELVLREFYLLAGKLGKDEEGVFRVEYDDDMQGVEVMEAVCQSVSVCDLTAEEGTAALAKFIPCNGTPNLDGLHRSLLSVQVTRLKDGVAVGCAFNHAVLDGTSTWHFMGSWAEACKGLPDYTITVPPVLDRSKIRNARVKLESYLASRPSKSDAGGPAPQTRDKVFKFSASSIAKIKSSVNAVCPAEHGKPFSTFQSLGVHIWRHVCRARESNPDDYTVFTVFMDCRKRVDPPLEESYFGNMIHAIFTVSPVGLLEGSEPAVGASMIQKSIDAHNHQAIDERNRDWESDPKIFQYKDAGRNCVVVGSSPRFRVYDVDFGWGKAENVRSGGNNRFDGMVYLYPGKQGGQSIDVEITLEAAVMEKLEKDQDFLVESAD